MADEENGAGTASRYIPYLPGVFQKKDSHLRKFLAPVETTLSEFDAILDAVDSNFAPGLASDDGFLPWLATWVALTLDEEWEEVKRRRLISQAVELYRWRGTVQGLKRYLTIYTELEPEQIEIAEARWPGGMQIGVASRIGGIGPDAIPLNTILESQRATPVYKDYLVVDTIARPEHDPPTGLPPDAPWQLYFDAQQVRGVEIGEDSVTIALRGESAPKQYKPATVIRRNQLIDDRYSLTIGETSLSNGSESPPDDESRQRIGYRGDSLLVSSIELPYQFIVNLRPITGIDRPLNAMRLNKVRTIIDLEKPAHTEYYLKVTPVDGRTRPQFMQIGIYSSIGLDTLVA